MSRAPPPAYTRPTERPPQSGYSSLYSLSYRSPFILARLFISMAINYRVKEIFVRNKCVCTIFTVRDSGR